MGSNTISNDEVSPREALTFQVIELESSVGTFDYAPNAKCSVIELFGRTDDNISVLVHVHCSFPYFYAEICSRNELSTKFAEDVKAKIHEKLETLFSIKYPVVKCIEIVSKLSVMFFQNGRRRKMLKITLFSHRLRESVINALRQIFTSVSFYDSDLSYLTQFMVDNGVCGCCWIQLKPGSFRTRREEWKRVSTCQLECDVLVSSLIVYSLEGSELKFAHPPKIPSLTCESLAAFRILSYDIECLNNEKGEFPQEDKNEVICIGTVVYQELHENQEDNVRKVLFTLNTCKFEEERSDVEVFSFSDEKQMLDEWSKFVRRVDPDIMVGYNSQNFDMPYLIKRARFLKAKSFDYLGRLKGTKSIIREKQFMSRQIGNKKNLVTNVNGRVQIDMLSVMQRDFKLRSYKLDDVASEFLGERKENVHFYEIRSLFFTSELTRGKLALYCLQDSLLPLKLLNKLMVLVKNVEMARVTGITLNEVLTRGQQIRIMSKLLRKCKERDMVVPRVPHSPENEHYVGAYVIEPQVGFYNEPIATLDFVSLYPSIMMAHNLCYSTLVFDEQISQFNLREGIDFESSPSGDRFVKKHVYSGLLPEILETLVARRKFVKNLLKDEKDKIKRQILDGRQLALKLTANSVYGFTGAQKGMLPCLDISRSVTTYGQAMLRKTRQEIESNYSACKVIYGDTDSVMIRFQIEKENRTKADVLREVMSIAKEQAAFVSSKFTKPIQLDFEKVYYPYLLVNKKRYAGLLFTKPEKHDKLDCKGLEIVRRDNCKLVPEFLKKELDLIFIEQNVEAALTYAKEVFDQVKNNSIPLDKLVITKQFAKTSYKAKQPHIELVEKIKKRNNGFGPMLGDRIPYIVIQNDFASKKQKLYEKAEDPQYAQEHHLKPDISYYINKQLAVPLIRILEHIIGKEKAEEMFSYKDSRSKKRKLVEDKLQPKIDSFFKKIKKEEQ